MDTTVILEQYPLKTGSYQQITINKITNDFKLLKTEGFELLCHYSCYLLHPTILTHERILHAVLVIAGNEIG